jgi:uncharacterized protein YoxC
MSISAKAAGRMLAITLVVVTAVLPPVLRSITRKPANSEVAAQLDAAKVEASELARDADDMTALVHNDTNWQSHADTLNRIADHVNNMGKILEKLQSERDEASPWQQQAIDRMVPLLKDIAANTTAAIEHLNKNQIRPVSGDYKDYLEQNADTAHELADTISAFDKYGRTRAKLEELQDKLEIPNH